MKSVLRRLFVRQISQSKSNDHTAATIESLECRRLFASGPQVAAIIADNRGQVKLTLTQTLKASTVNSSTVRILTAGVDGELNTADDVVVPSNIQLSGKTLYITANTPANKLYRIQMISGGVIGTNGKALVGNSGTAGAAGGNFDETTVAPNFIAYMNTPAGFIQVVLDSNTPITNQNFVNYANAGAWDGTIIHRNAATVDATTLAETPSNFIIQAGGFRVTSGKFDVVPANAAITNEPVNSNTKYTISMAKLGTSVNSATNQFFFNLGDNSSNLDSQNGGFAAFGTVTDKASQKVIDALNKNYPPSPLSSATFDSTGTTVGLFNTTNSTSALLASSPNLTTGETAGTGLFDNMPVQNVQTILNAKALDATRDSVIIFRVSFLMSILPSTQSGVVSPAATRAAAVETTAASASAFSTTPISTPTAAWTGGSIFAGTVKKDIWA